jgi:tetratricopeptide (TPR) repeat protein
MVLQSSTIKNLIITFGLLLITFISLKGQDEGIAFNTSFFPVNLSEAEQIKLAKSNIRKDSTNTRHWLVLGNLWEGMLQYDSATIAYKKAVNIDNSCIRCKQQLASVLSIKGNVSSALHIYTEALKLDSTNTTIRSQYAKLLKRDNRFNEALYQFQYLLNNDKANYYLWEQVGDCALRVDSMSLGNLAYMYSFELNPANMPLAIKLINSYIQALVPPVFIMPFAEKAYKQDSTYIPLIRAKGYLYFLSEDYKNSDIWLSKAYERGDSSKFTNKYLGVSKYYLGKNLTSATLLEKVFAVDSTDKVVNVVFAKALVKIGDWKKAIEVIDITEELMTPLPKEIASLYAIRGDSYVRANNPTLAIKNFSKAFEINPEYLDYIYEIGFNYYLAKDYPKAKEYLNIYLQKMEENPEEKKLSKRISQAKYYLSLIEKKIFFGVAN